MNKVKYIIDYKGYGNTYDLTNTRNGEHTEIDRDSAMDYVLDNQHRAADGYATDTYFSIKADVSLRSVPQREIFEGVNNALSNLTITI